MIYIDDRVGSRELAPHLPRARLRRLHFGDFCFGGGGPNDAPVPVGIERKRIRDLLNSITSGRLTGHQLVGMRNTYEHIYLVIEGRTRTNEYTGVLEEQVGEYWCPLALGKRTWLTSDILCFLNTLDIHCGVHWHWTYDMTGTAAYIKALHKWWTAKDFDEHRAHLQPHRGTTVALTKSSLLRRVAAELPHIGWKKSKDVEAEFVSVNDMVFADQAQWMGIEGIGKKIAGDIEIMLNGGRV